MKRNLRMIAAGIAFSSLLACTACGNHGTDSEFYRFTSYSYFNTQIDWVFETDGAPSEEDYAVWNEIRAELLSIDKSISLSYESSSVSLFNAAGAGEEVELDETAYRILSFAQEIYEKTDGAYNPAVGNLVDLWGFSPRFGYSYEPEFPYDRDNPRTELPAAEYVEAFLRLTDFSQVTLSERDGKYYALKPACEAEMEGVVYNMQINLGGIGKGYAIDRVNAMVRAAGYQYGYVNLGGSSMSVLKNFPNDGKMYFPVGVVNPRKGILYSGDSFMSVKAEDVCLSSSGDYEQYYELGGKRYSHIISPFTGYPVNAAPENTGGIVCASVFGLTAAEGDATTTALTVMGCEAAAEYIREELSGVKVCFVYDKGDGTFALYTNMQEGDYTVNAEMEIIKI